MTWNYRVIFNKDEFQIYEVYYNEAGEITAVSEDAITPSSESAEELQGDLEYYSRALKMPVLKMEEIVFAPMDKGSSEE